MPIPVLYLLRKFSRGSSDKNDEQLVLEAAHHATVYHSVTGSSHNTATSPHQHEIVVTNNATAEVPSSGTVDHDQFSFWNLSISQRVEV